MKKYQINTNKQIFESLKFGSWLLCVICILALVIFPALVHAQSPSTASPSSTLIEKINQIKKEVASKAAQIKQEITKKIQNKVYFGNVLKMEEGKLTLERLTNLKTVLIDEYTIFKSKFKSQKSKLSFKDIKESDFLVALGDVDDNGELKAKQIIKSPNLASDSAKLIWGEIQSVSQPNVVIKNKDGQKITIKTSSKTILFLGNEEASILDAKVGKHLVVKGEMSNDKTLSAKYIYFIPSPGFTQAQKPKDATFSTTPSASSKK